MTTDWSDDATLPRYIEDEPNNLMLVAPPAYIPLTALTLDDLEAQLQAAPQLPQQQKPPPQKSTKVIFLFKNKFIKIKSLAFTEECTVGEAVQLVREQFPNAFNKSKVSVFDWKLEERGNLYRLHRTRRKGALMYITDRGLLFYILRFLAALAIILCLIGAMIGVGIGLYHIWAKLTSGSQESGSHKGSSYPFGYFWCC